MQVRHYRLMCVSAAVLAVLGCNGANVFYRQGRKAELDKDYDTALVNFEKAAQIEPDNPQILLHERMARTQAANFHLRQGRRLLADNRPDEAAGEFQKAVGIDPSNQAAGQELARIAAAQSAAKRQREKELQQGLKKKEGPAGPPVVQLKPLPVEPIAHIRLGPADARRVYETLGKLGDLNVAFTQDFGNIATKPVSLDLTNVKLEEALQVLAYETHTFWKPITPNTILVIPDNAANHRDYDEQVLRTVYLSNPLPNADRTQILTAVKQLLTVQKVVDNPDTNAIVISDTPAKVAAAEQLIHDLDRGKAEVLVDIAILEADRDRIRDLGLTPVPTAPLSGSQMVGVGFTPPATTSGGTTTPSPGLPLNELGKISTADFTIVVPGYVANALLSDTHTRILQNPEVRTSDGQKATLNIGSKIPIATGSFLPSFAGTTGSPSTGVGLLASTQFQYQDVGVKIEITPHVLSTGEVSLHAKVDITSLGASVVIAGISQPTFGQRTIEHDIRLKEGEVSVLGGLVQSTVSDIVSGLPGLGQIPIVRYFFSTEHKERNEQEVIVMLTPHVVRLPEDIGGGRQISVGRGASGTVSPFGYEPPAANVGTPQ
jgi:general secretion pathway protein D